MKFLVSLAVLLTSAFAHAGFFEVGASGNYKKTHIADDVVDENLSITGSLAYLIDVQSALELSYTQGEQRTEVGASSGNNQIQRIDYRMAGLDFIYTFGEQQSTLRPYLKLGGMYIIEKKRRTYYLFNTSQVSTSQEEPSLVPSAGVGFKLALSQSLSLKAGYDVWASKSVSQKGVRADYATRVGLSWLF
jgi:outer membrane protein W